MWKCGKRGVCVVCVVTVWLCLCVLGGGGGDQHVVAFGF